MIRIGIVGLGHVAQRCHLPALKLLPEFEIIGFFDESSQVREQFREQLASFGSLPDLLNSKLDAVIIATPSNTHSEICIEALKLKIHVLVEKPISLNVNDTKAIKEQLEKSGAKLFVGLHLRHSRQVDQTRRMLKTKMLGQVIGFQSVFCNNIGRRQTVSGYETKREKGGGVLYDLAYHHIDLFSHLFGQKITAVKSDFRSSRTEDDICTIEYKIGESLLGNSFFSSNTQNEHVVRVFFEEGSVLIDFFKSRSLYVFKGRNSVRQKLIAEMKYSLSMGGMLVNAFARRRIEPYAIQLRSFSTELGGEKTHLATYEDGLNALKAVLAAYASKRTNQYESVA